VSLRASDLPVLKRSQRRARWPGRRQGAPQANDPILEVVDRDHTRVLNDRLTAKVDELDRLNLRCEQLNEQLRSSELEYRLLFDANPLPMLVYERATLQVVAVNRALVSTYGYLRSELLVMAITDLLPPEDVDSLLVFLAVETPGVRSGSERDLAGHPWRHRYKDGTIVDVEVVTANMTLHEVDCRMALCQNVTERRRASADLAVARDQAVAA
jgi:PAS domain S-box-containing protein